jgi:hypothetical protein
VDIDPDVFGPPGTGSVIICTDLDQAKIAKTAFISTDL